MTELLLGEKLIQLISFKLGSEAYCIPINKVLEVNRKVKITLVPNSPDFIEGIINLRGQIVPVIDLAKRFSLISDQHLSSASESRIVIVESSQQRVGFIVDEVQEVMRLHESSVKAAPALLATQIERDYIAGVVVKGEALIIILDVDRVFASHELSALGQVSKPSEEIL